MSKQRKYLTDEEASYLNLQLTTKQKGQNLSRYSLSNEQWQQITELRSKGVIDSCSNLEVDPKTVKHLWKKTKEESIFIKNPLYKDELEKTFNELESNVLSSIDKIIAKGVKPIKVKAKKIIKGGLFDVGVYTDAHIGMNPNPNGYSLYGGKWDETQLNENLTIFINQTIKNQKSNKLILFDLGDFMDGWNGETVRKGHELPQNMDNEKAFDVGLEFKVKMIDSLVNHFQQIEVINICEDNHAGSFGYVVNSAFKRFIEARYKSVKVINQRKFIDHYKYGNKVFVATHGKDGKNLKFGFKPKLDPIQIEKIENYLFDNDLVSKSNDIYFIKGDSHQDIFDNSTSQKFKYWNFPAFSPSSNWVQTNFKKGISGFYNFTFYKSKYTIHPYYFKWI